MTTKKATTRRSAKSPQKPRKAPEDGRGNMKPTEIRPLVIAARHAFDYQCKLNTVDDAATFDDWRRQQVLAVTGHSGLTACNHGDFRPLLAHFEALAGRDEKAFDAMMNSGKVRDNGPDDDTHERRDHYAHLIRQNLAEHIELATTTEPLHDARLRARTAIDEHGAWIGEGYVIGLARAVSGTGVRSLDDLADRLTARQLENLLSTVRNCIAGREGRGNATKRNADRRETAARDKKIREARIDAYGPSFDRPKSDPF